MCGALALVRRDQGTRKRFRLQYAILDFGVTKAFEPLVRKGLENRHNLSLLYTGAKARVNHGHRATNENLRYCSCVSIRCSPCGRFGGREENMDTRTISVALKRPVSSLDQAPERRMWLGKAFRNVAGGITSAAHRALSPMRRRPGLLPFARDADVLIIVPPFASLYIPSLAAHTLQALALQVGYRVDVLYASTLFASSIGERAYNRVAWEPIGPLAAERLFARWAFGLPPLGHNARDMFRLHRMFGEKQARIYAASLNLKNGEAAWTSSVHHRAAVRRLRRLEEKAGDWLDEVAKSVAERPYRVVGCTTTFEQTVSSIALLDRIKRLRSDIVTIIGGANCEGEMAEGIASLSDKIDYIFSGESDETFPKFLQDALAGERPKDKIICGRPYDNMDAQSTPRFHEFFEQRELYLPWSRQSSSTYISYETSRGCWWGQKQHCTFCGLNGEGMASRRKSAERVIEELKAITDQNPTRNIGMTDNIMPHEYFKTLLPKLSGALPPLSIFYEQKANLTLPQVLALKEAGISTVQPGIEALSSPMLRLMKKGVQAWQNLLLLRYARIAGIRLQWAILCGFPGDNAEIYAETLRLVRLIRHLPPPAALWHLSIDRFSPYFMSPQEFGVTDVTPYPAYADVFPPNSDKSKLAYHFVAKYESAADHNLEIIRDLGREVSAWRSSWARAYTKRPELKIEQHRGSYVLLDTRGIPGTDRIRALDDDKAAFLLTHRRYGRSKEEDTALDQKLAVISDGWFIPLPVARIDRIFDLFPQQADTKGHRGQLAELGARRSERDVRQGLVRIACSGPIAPLEHPLAPQ